MQIIIYIILSMKFSFWLLFLLTEPESALVGPDCIDAHGAPGLTIDIVECDGFGSVRGLLLLGAYVLGNVVGRDEVGTGSTAGFAERAVDLLELEDNYAFVKGFSKIVDVHRILSLVVGRY